MHTQRNIVLTLFTAVGLVLTPVVAHGGPAPSTPSICYNNLDRTTYDSGFNAADFDSSTDVNIVGGDLQLDTDERELGDANNITVRTRQNLTAHYVYESAGASHTFGYFVWNSEVTKFMNAAGWNFTATTCTAVGECDPGQSCVLNGGTKYCAYPKYTLKDDGTAGGWAGNMAYDWFEELYVKSCSTCLPSLLSASRSDGGTYPAVSNLLESLVSTQGGWIFLLADDDDGTYVYYNLAPVADISSTHNNGVPDYDVNGDGTVNDDDRSVDMGTFDAGTELVFFLNVYYEQKMRKTGAGIGAVAPTCTTNLVCPSSCWSTGTADCTYCLANCAPTQWDAQCAQAANCGNCRPYNDTVCTGTNDGEVKSRIIPYFSKRVLNPDYKDSGDVYIDRDIGCPYGSTCSGYGGWVDSDALNRLKNLYGLNMGHEIKRIHQRIDGQSDHIFVGAPSSDPHWWILGFEDLYDHGDRDFNDLVFLIFRTNGGETVSGDVATEIPAADKDDTTITRVLFKKEDSFPAPCTGLPEDARIEYYISVSIDANGDPIWLLVEFPPSSPDEVTVELSEFGLAGSTLRWKAVIISNDHDCKPKISDVDIGYEALRHGEYLFTSPLLLSNVLFRGASETRDDTWTVTGNDYSNRGHFRMYEMYQPEAPDTETNTLVWDAGTVLSTRDPDTRKVWTSNGTSTENITATGSSWLLGQILTAANRAEKLNAKPVYDFDKDGDSDDEDARYLIQWTRGWETPTTLQRAWKMGAINRATAAVVHPPGEPSWLEAGGVPLTWRTAYRSWSEQVSVAERRTMAYVGSQSGMLHAFDAGAFRWGDNPDTGAVEYRGYFKWINGNPDYGTGAEAWAYVPPSLVNSLKNNRMKTYYPEQNPPAMVDGAITVSDVMTKNGAIEEWKTAVFFHHGTQHAYVSALDVTNPSSPKALWASDWTDSDFQGSYSAPSVAWFPSGTDPSWVMTTTSGLSKTPGDVFLFLVDVTTGNTLATDGKLQLNTGTVTQAAQAYGVAGRPVMVDSDEDGVTDRIYVADTNGRVWRYSPQAVNNKICMVAAVGQPIYVTPSIDVRRTSNNIARVTFYFGTGDSPSENDTATPPYSFYGFVDNNNLGECSLAELLFDYKLPTDEKIWGDAAIAADRIYVGSATGNKADICDEDSNNPGHIYSFYLDPTTPGVAAEVDSPVEAAGNIISGLTVYDQHVVANTVGGKTVVIGGSSWNNLSGIASNTDLKDVYWNEVINNNATP
jgi:type IV pilus assembly protein PilY1